MDKYSIKNVRKDVIGNNVLFNTPFGERHLLYADYTVSGRGVRSIENKIINILQSYANTHTEDAYSGKYLTNLLHKAKELAVELKKEKEVIFARDTDEIEEIKFFEYVNKAL